MENGPITVTPISLEHAKTPGPGPNLGARTSDELQTQAQVGGLLAAVQRTATQAFRLEWQGNKVPDGAVVGGHTISWTQNGQVIDDEGEFIGTYERIVEFGGESRREQKMHVYLF